MKPHAHEPRFDPLFDESSTTKQDETLTLPSGNTFSTCSDTELDRRVKQAELASGFNNWTKAPATPMPDGKIRGMRKRGRGHCNAEILKYWKENDPQPEEEFSQSRLDDKRRLQGIDPPSTAPSTTPASEVAAGTSTTASDIAKPHQQTARKAESSSTRTPQPSDTASAPATSSENDFKIVHGLFDLSYKQYADGTTEMIRNDGYKRAEVYIDYLDGLTAETAHKEPSCEASQADDGETCDLNPSRSRPVARTGPPTSGKTTDKPRQAPVDYLEPLNRYKPQWSLHDDATDRARQLQRLRTGRNAAQEYRNDFDSAAARMDQFSRRDHASTDFDSAASRLDQFSRHDHASTVDDVHSRMIQSNRSRSTPADHDDPTHRMRRFTRYRGDTLDDANARQAQFSQRTESEDDRRNQFTRHRPRRDSGGEAVTDGEVDDTEHQRRSRFTRHRRVPLHGSIDDDEAANRARQFRRQILADACGVSDDDVDETFVDTDDADARMSQMQRRRQHDANGVDDGTSLPYTSAELDSAEARRRQLRPDRQTRAFESDDDEAARSRQMHRRPRAVTTDLDIDDNEDVRRAQMSRQHTEDAFSSMDSGDDRRNQFTRNRRNVFSPVNTAISTDESSGLPSDAQHMMHGANGPSSSGPYSSQMPGPPQLRPPPFTPRGNSSTMNPSLDSRPDTQATAEVILERPRNILFADQPHGEERPTPTAYTQPGSQHSAWPTRGPLSSMPPPRQARLASGSPDSRSDAPFSSDDLSYDQRTDMNDRPHPRVDRRSSPGAMSDGTDVTLERRDTQLGADEATRQRRWSTGAKVAAGLSSAAGVAGGAYYLYNHPEAISDMSTHTSQAWEGAKGAASSAFADPSAAWEATRSGVGSMASSMKDAGSALYTTASDHVPGAESLITTAKGVTSSVANVMDTATSYLPGPVRRFGAGALGHLAQGRVASALQSAAGL